MIVFVFYGWRQFGGHSSSDCVHTLGMTEGEMQKKNEMCHLNLFLFKLCLEALPNSTHLIDQICHLYHGHLYCMKDKEVVLSEHFAATNNATVCF